MMLYFLGGGMQLATASLSSHFTQTVKLRTVAMGTVKLLLSVITRHFDRFGIIS